MSLFALILYPDGRAVQRAEVDRLLNPIGYAGPGGRAVWTDGPLGIGCLYPGGRARTAVGEQPVQAADGRFTLVADARLDARADLGRALGWASQAVTSASDPALLLAAWQRWGQRCGEWVYGDYAFVVHDRQAGTLSGSTDAPGARRLLSARLCSGALLIASDEACLLAHDELIDGWAEVPLAFWLMGTPQRNRSIFPRIEVAACGETMTFQDGRLRIETWWDPTGIAPVRHRTTADYANAYRELLTEIIDARLQGTTAVVCELSGGMDSSSVTAATRTIADRRDVHLATISHTYPGFPTADDRWVMEATRAALGITDAVVVDAVDLMRRLLPTRMGPRAESPGAFSNLFHDLAIEAASTRGADTILVGFGGDELTRGALFWSISARLARGDWRAPAELVATSSCRGERLTKVAFRDLLRPAARALLGDLLADRLSGIRSWQRFLPVLLNGGKPLTRKLLAESRAVAQQAGRNSRLRKIVRELHFTPSWYQMDAYRLNAASASITPQAPLLDRRILEFVAGSPAELWYREGLSKYLARQAFAGILPSAPRQAVRKVMVTAPVRAVWAGHRPWALAILRTATECTGTGNLTGGFERLMALQNCDFSTNAAASSSILFALWWVRRAGSATGQA